MMDSASTVLQSALQPVVSVVGFGELENVSSGKMVLRAILIYAMALLLVRIGSKRLLSQATAFDVIVAILLGSVLSRAINGSASFIPTILASAALIGLHWLFATLAYQLSFFGSLVKGRPRLLINDGKVQEAQMRAAKLSKQDLDQALRLHSRQDPSSIQRAYLERNGTISIIPFKQEPRVLDVAVEEGVQTIRLQLE